MKKQVFNALASISKSGFQLKREYLFTLTNLKVVYVQPGCVCGNELYWGLLRIGRDVFLRIVVCIKQVPETRNVEIDERTGVLLRDGVDSIMNPYDLHALEVALRIKEDYGGTVFVISMGPPQAEAVIREAYMMGADQGFLLSDRAFAGADTLATAYTLARGIQKIGEVDLIVCGLQTTDGDTAQVGPGIAEFLRIPHESNVMRMSKVQCERIEVVSDLGTFVHRKRIKCPCLITVTKAVAQPRLLSYRLKKATMNRTVTTWSAIDIADGEDDFFGLRGSPTQVERIFAPETTQNQEVWQGSPNELAERLAQKLRELKLVGGDGYAHY